MLNGFSSIKHNGGGSMSDNFKAFLLDVFRIIIISSLTSSLDYLINRRCRSLVYLFRSQLFFNNFII